MLSNHMAAAALMLAAAAQAAPADDAAPAAATADLIVAEPVAAPAAPSASALVLRRDTPIHFMVVSEVTTKTHTAGHRFKLRVDKPVSIDGVMVIPVGTTAWGEVLEAEKSGNAGKSGTLSAKLLYVDIGGIQVPISGNNDAKGSSGTGETVLGVLALGPLGLFAKGNNAKIKAGELMTGFVEQDTALPAPAGL
ncbi:MAG: hypothetical protein ACREB7_06460 [Sphingopyxis sp.]|uniref:hypothetical protein n=1 Tax=Sphingopyxis sp. TaxID=1908224 RepID=UPI003D6D5DC1